MTDIRQKSNCDKPSRISVHDELSREKTLDASKETFKDIFGNPIPSSYDDDKPILLLGLGPSPANWLQALPKQSCDKNVRWMECPDFEKQMPESWSKTIPGSWKRCSLEETLPHSSNLHIYKYAPAYRLFSNFWGPIISKFQQKILGLQTSALKNASVIIPTSERSLLTYELISACKNIGVTPIAVPLSLSIDKLTKLIKETNPSLFFSVNLRGLDNEGFIFRLLQTMNIPTAIWFVDNPWNILSSLRLPWWKETSLFVSDASFISDLKSHGAPSVYHLPLASWGRSEKNAAEPPMFSKPILFIGRTSFPNKNNFFSGCNLPDALLHEAKERLYTKNPPNFDWWIKKLRVTRLWPGKEARPASYGAEKLSLARRARWLEKASRIGLTVLGDNAWKKYLPSSADIKEPVDYYSRLPLSVTQAKYNLNVTSLLLPQGLTQRHFDVWTFGGFLLTDATNGLQIFPKELVDPILISRPEDIATRVEAFEKDPSLRTTLARAWKQYLIENHTYAVRMRQVLSTMAKNKKSPKIFPY